MATENSEHIEFHRGEQLYADKLNKLAEIAAFNNKIQTGNSRNNYPTFFAKVLGSGVASGYERVVPWAEVQYLTDTGYDPIEDEWMWNTSGSGQWIEQAGNRFAASGDELNWAFVIDGVWHESGDIVCMNQMQVSGIIRYVCWNNSDPPLPYINATDDTGSGVWAKVVTRAYTSGLDVSGWASGWSFKYSWMRIIGCP